MTASALHGWFPTSSCGDACIGRGETVSGTRRLIRVTYLIAVLALVLPIGAAVSWLPRYLRRRYLRWASSMVLGALGISVEVRDDRPFAGSGTGLVVANHTSFLDIVAIATIVPSRFVAKAEVAESPVLGYAARRFGVIPIRRDSLRRLPTTVAEVTRRLQADDAVGVFPEGTTFCGRRTGRFHPALFEAAVVAAVPVLPISVSFHGPDGQLSAASSFIGADEPIDTLRRVIAARGLQVRIRIHELELPSGDRRELAARCERAVLGTAGRDISAPSTAPQVARPLRLAG